MIYRSTLWIRSSNISRNVSKFNDNNFYVAFVRIANETIAKIVLHIQMIWQWNFYENTIVCNFIYGDFFRNGWGSGWGVKRDNILQSEKVWFDKKKTWKVAIVVHTQELKSMLREFLMNAWNDGKLNGVLVIIRRKRKCNISNRLSLEISWQSKWNNFCNASSLLLLRRNTFFFFRCISKITKTNFNLLFCWLLQLVRVFIWLHEFDTHTHTQTKRYLIRAEQRLCSRKFQHRLRSLYIWLLLSVNLFALKWKVRCKATNYLIMHRLKQMENWLHREDTCIKS